VPVIFSLPVVYGVVLIEFEPEADFVVVVVVAAVAGVAAAVEFAEMRFAMVHWADLSAGFVAAVVVEMPVIVLVPAVYLFDVVEVLESVDR